MSDVDERRVVDYDVDVDALAAAAAEVMVDDGVEKWGRPRLSVVFGRTVWKGGMRVWVTKYMPATRPVERWVDGEWQTTEPEPAQSLTLTPDGAWEPYTVVLGPGPTEDSLAPHLVELPDHFVSMLRQDPEARQAFFDAVTGDGPVQFGTEHTTAWFADGVDESLWVRSGDAAKAAEHVNLTVMPAPTRRPWWRRLLNV